MKIITAVQAIVYLVLLGALLYTSLLLNRRQPCYDLAIAWQLIDTAAQHINPLYDNYYKLPAGDRADLHDWLETLDEINKRAEALSLECLGK